MDEGGQGVDKILGDKVRRKVVIAFRLVWTVEGGELKSRRVIVLG